MNQREYEYEKVASAIQVLTTQWKNQPSLEEIAGQVHVSPFHFQRMFTEWAGVSPKKFLQYLTLSHIKKRLNSRSLAETAEEAGLSSPSRLHDLFVNIEAMTPGEYKNGGGSLKIQYSVQNCQFGRFLVASTPKGICHLHFFEDLGLAMQEFAQTWPHAQMEEKMDHHQQQVAQFFENNVPQNDRVHLHLRGTNFQLKVWEALLRIPQGSLTTYGTIAQYIENPSASRAVGSAIASNPIAFIIPCHRVIRQAGNIGEFRWGTVRKQAMIGWEASQLKVGNE